LFQRCKTEVANLHCTIDTHQKIGRFYIPVHNPVRVAMLDAKKHLLESHQKINFLELRLLQQHVKKRVVTPLHDKVAERAIHVSFEQTHHMLMTPEPFPKQTLYYRFLSLGLASIDVNNLYCASKLGVALDACTNLAKCTLPELLLETISLMNAWTNRGRR